MLASLQQPSVLKADNNTYSSAVTKPNRWFAINTVIAAAQHSLISDCIHRPRLRCVAARAIGPSSGAPRGLLTVVAEPVPIAPHPPSIGMNAAALALAVGASAVALGRFATADADMGLLLRGSHRRGAFEGQVIWVTGASQGLGEALARYLSSQGARLVLSSRSSEKLQRVKDACSGAHSGDIVLLPLDLTGPQASLEDAARRADEAFGGAGVDFLIHNAGASQHALASETSAEVARKLLDINALAPIALTRAALPHMLARKKGRIVVVSSMAARVPAPGQATYSAAKAAQWGYFASLATEVADQGIGVTICCPGPISTGTPGAPRVIYGAEGLIQQQQHGAKGKVTPERCAKLIADAMAHGLSECWIAKHPVLLVAYLMQYVPSLGWAVLKKIGPARARAVSSGRSGYDVTAILGDSRGEAKAGRGGGGGGGSSNGGKKD